MEFIIRAPYLTTALFALVPYEERRIPTCAVTEGQVLLYNPDYFQKLADMPDGVVKIASRLWHEVNHKERETLLRLPDATPKRRNICSDFAINSSGRKEWDFEPDGLLPSKHKLPDDLTMEEYDRLLPPYKEMTIQCGFGEPNESGGCGSGAGNPTDEEVEAEADKKVGRSKEEVQAIEAQVAMEIQDYANRHPGKVPSNLTEWAQAKLTKPKVPWTKELAAVVRYTTGMIIAGAGRDVSYLYISPRTHTRPPGPLMPGEIDQEVLPCFVLDTSGSMGINTDIATALREVRGALLSCNCQSAWLLQVDAGVAKTSTIRTCDLHKIEIHGRGGTDFGPGIHAAETLSPKPDVIIYLTDGYGPAPDTAPKIPVIWVIVGENEEAPATWGRAIFTKD